MRIIARKDPSLSLGGSTVVKLILRDLRRVRAEKGGKRKRR